MLREVGIGIVTNLPTRYTSGCENVGNAKINVSSCVDNEMDGKGREGTRIGLFIWVYMYLIGILVPVLESRGVSK